MSKSEKRRKARERADQPQPEAAPPEAPESEEAPLELAAPQPPMPLNEALYEQALEAATRAGVMREEGDRLMYLYNGPELSLKYVEATETEGAALLVAVFRQGVVFQVRDGKQVTYKPGDWEREIAQLATAEAPQEEEEEA